MQYRMNLLLVVLAAAAVLVGTAGVAQADLIAHWAFDETFGTTANDSADAHHGTIDIANGVVINQPGKIGKCYSFPGGRGANGQRGVVVPNADDLEDMTAVTLCQWFRLTEMPAAGTHTICKANGGYNYFVSLRTGSPYQQASFGYDSWSKLHSVYADYSAYADSKWHQLTATWLDGADADASEIYLDGALVTSGHGNSANTVMTGNDSPVYLGTNPYSTTGYASFNGKMDDLGIWSEVLSAGKAMSLYWTPNVSGLEDYNLSYMEKLFEVYDATGSKTETIGSLTWEYVSSIPGAQGEGKAWFDAGTQTYYVQLSNPSGVKAVIPEPSTLMLLASGLLGLLAYAWRKRK